MSSVIDKKIQIGNFVMFAGAMVINGIADYLGSKTQI